MLFSKELSNRTLMSAGFTRMLVLTIGGTLLAGCATRLSNLSVDTFKPYVAEVVQGNFVSLEQRQALKLGMPRAQVREILGTPLISSLFHEDRWDYNFSIRRQGLAPQAYRLTVFFRQDRLVEIESDVLPSESEFVGRLSGRQNLGKPPVLQLSEEALKRLPVKPTPPKTPATPTPRTYPPLEGGAR
ncbi:outer membrane protein assembly factor BamE [Limnohabitans sp.]|uniref:outer membrane protein assembly factor BamE n=1 Tax=Limnohabitans sp. TaxID=1907725 RepID=UPI00391C800E